MNYYEKIESIISKSFLRCMILSVNKRALSFVFSSSSPSLIWRRRRRGKNGADELHFVYLYAYIIFHNLLQLTTLSLWMYVEFCITCREKNNMSVHKHKFEIIRRNRLWLCFWLRVFYHSWKKWVLGKFMVYLGDVTS